MTMAPELLRSWWRKWVGPEPASTPRWFLLTAALVFAIGIWGALQWTLIPVAVDGTVTGVGWQSESGLEFRELTLDSDRTLIVARSVVERAGGEEALLGAVATKSHWDTRVVVDGNPTRLSLLDGTARPALSLALVVGISLARRAKRSL